jgi:hypothetical protein
VSASSPASAQSCKKLKDPFRTIGRLFFGPGKRQIAHDRVFGLGTKARKIASGDKWRYIGSQAKDTSEIRVEDESSDKGLPSSIPLGHFP